MGRSYAWALAHALLAGMISAAEISGECALATTPTTATTVFVPTTIYISAPSTAIIPGGDYCGIGTTSTTRGPLPTSSSATTTEATIPTSTISFPTSSSSLSRRISSISFSSGRPTITDRGNSSATRTSSLSSRSVTSFPTPTSIRGLPPPPPSPGPFKGYKNSVYFTNWGISQAGYPPQKLPVDDLSHVLYAFADIAPNGTVLSADPVADLKQKYPQDDSDDGNRGKAGGPNAYGAVKQLYIHKKWNRNLKVLLSVGGGAYSPKFAAATSTEMRRQTFAKSAVKLVTDWGFDGVDIDWEYPTSETEKQNLVKLLAACRDAFDSYSFRNRVRYRFLVTVASPATPSTWKFVDLPQMDRYVDVWHLMSYDYAGSWHPQSAHQANVFANKANPASTPSNMDDAVRYYASQGIDTQKIVVGLPLYGRSFNGTSGLGQNYTAVGTAGPQWYYKNLPRPGAREEFDDIAKATYSYDRAARELVSYDNVRSTVSKAQYVRERRLGGAFFWEASGDRTDGKSLLKTMSRTLDWVDGTPNNLHYPTSQYQNIRLGLPWE